jgi:tetratricopeptide (TPR) repeat protein
MSNTNINKDLKEYLVKLEFPVNESNEKFENRLNHDLKFCKYDNYEIAITLHNLAQSHMMQGDLDKAESYFKKAVEYYKTTDDEHNLVFCMSQFALVLKPQKKSKEAQKLLIELVRLCRKLGYIKKDVKNWFLKSYFLNLLQVYGEKTKAIELRNLLNQEWHKHSK